jgi:hypothetical protein
MSDSTLEAAIGREIRAFRTQLGLTIVEAYGALFKADLLEAAGFTCLTIGVGTRKD